MFDNQGCIVYIKEKKKKYTSAISDSYKIYENVKNEINADLKINYTFWDADMIYSHN